MAEIPLQGDRSAWDVDNYPARHASDLNSSTPVNHVPAGGSSGDGLVWNGTKWVAQAGGASPPIMSIGTYNGTLQVGETPLRIYNRYGHDREIAEVFISVGTPPTGQAIKVDIKIDGVSIFSGGNEPQIAVSGYTGSSVTFADPTWATGEYLTWNITQIGSGDAGADLTVHVIHNKSAGGSGS